MSIIFFLICLGASVIGAICGIGGGVIIKPVLDAFGLMSVATISFLSGCTVLAMTTYSVIKSKMSGTSALQKGTSFPLAAGAAIGGLVGKNLFEYVKALSSNPDKVGMVQAICLLILTFGTLLYTLAKASIRTKEVKNVPVCVTIGFCLGICSSFLGIGGGPFNLVVLFYFFSMDTKTAAENSLYIIFFSQITSLLTSLVTKSVPAFEIPMLLFMVAGGIGGGMIGRKINQTIDEQKVTRLFLGLLVVIIGICIYNIFQFI